MRIWQLIIRKKYTLLPGRNLDPRKEFYWLCVERFMESRTVARVLGHIWLTRTLHDLCYTPSRADPDVWIQQVVKPDGFEY